MSEKTPVCPYCGQQITSKKLSEIEERIALEKEQEIKKRFEAERRKAAVKMEKKEAELLKREEQLGREKEKAKRQGITEGQKLISSKYMELETQVKVREGELSQYRKREEDLVRRETLAKQREERFGLDLEKQVAKKLEGHTERIRKEEFEKHEMERRERDKKEGELQKQVAELQIKLIPGSPQQRGDLQEDWLLDLLQGMFPSDKVTKIPKKGGGADVFQVVNETAFCPVGSIYWESKRTKDWNENWLAKLREDQRDVKADIAVLVSKILPEDQPNGGLRNGVLVVPLNGVELVAPILRDALLNVHQQKIVTQNQDLKTQRLLEYFGGKEFNLLLAGIVENMAAFSKLDDQEEKAIAGVIAKRRELRAQSVRYIANLYGTLKGIMGTLPEVRGLELPSGQKALLSSESEQQ